MSTRFEKITYLGRKDSSLTEQEHSYQMRQTNRISKKIKDKWYKDGLKIYPKTTYLKAYYKDKDYWKRSISDDELLSQIALAGGHSRLLKTAGRRIAELLDELEK